MERVHIDFFEYRGKHVLLMVDSFSKKIWTTNMNTDTTTTKTLAVLYGWFCSESGVPTTLVSDNGPQFTSNEFKNKMLHWGIKHVLSPPYHPASNGAAERAVQLFKDRLNKMNVSARPVDLFLALAYIGKVHGLTPHSSTDRCPFELIKQGPVPSLFPKLTSGVSKMSELTTVRDSISKMRKRKNFDEGEKVIVYDVHKKLSYPAVVTQVLGTNNYLVESGNGPKHISGDVMSRRTAAAAVDARDSQIDSRNNNNDLHDNLGTSSISDDSESISSDLSEDIDDLFAPHIVGERNFNNNVRPRRRVPREVANLGNFPQSATRLRSGRIYSVEAD